MTHANTPAIEVFDPRGRGVRSVAYHRRDGVTAPESCITQQVHDVVGRAVLSRDPRLFDLHQQGQAVANQINVLNLSGAMLLSKNSDAGWRLALFGEDGQGVEGWDQKLSHSHTHHDEQRRPIALFENAHGEPERCIARFSYADASADETRNRRGQLIRQDDTAGTLRFVEFGLTGTPLEHSRTFTVDPHWSVDWSVDKNERDDFLEEESAVTHIHCNAAGEPVRQTDAKGNVQTFIHTRAAELKEVRLTLAGLEEKTLVSDIDYNAFGQIERQRAGNGVVSCATFRPEDGRLEHLKAYLEGQPALQDLTYDYDAVGNIVCLTDASAPIHYHRNQRIEPINRYCYDSLYRLIKASGRQLRNAPGGPQLPEFQSAPDPGQLENYTRVYTYDKAGNLTVMQHQAASANRTERTAVAASNNRSLPEKADGELPDENEIAAGYDLNGNRNTLQPGQDLLWDLRNQLRQVEQVVRENEPNDIEFYLYDGSGQRLRKIRQAYTGTLTRTHETRYLPDVETRTSADEILHVITVKAGRGSVQVLHWEKKPASDIPQNQLRYSFTDHLNSSTLELDDVASLITWESYYPYGGTCWWAGRNKLEANYKTLRYSGQERDATGLLYYGRRYYAPWSQRWLSADPAGIADELNLFAMVGGNPVGYIDRRGLDRTAAITTNTAIDGMATFFGTVTRMTVFVGLSQLPPTETTNNLLLATAVALESGSAAYVAVGLAANNQSMRAVPLLTGAAAAALAAIPAFSNRSDLEENQLNTDAIDRIATVMGNFVREGIQVAGNQQGGNYPWGETGLLSRLRSVGPTAIVYGGIRAASNYLQAGLHSSLRGFFAFIAEAADGGIGTLFRSLHPNTTYQEGTGQINFDRQYAHNVLHGGIGRNVSATINREITRLLSPLISTLPPEIQSAILGATGFWTEFRGVVMAAVKRGYDSVASRVTGPTLGDSLSENPGPSRRNSTNSLHTV